MPLTAEEANHHMRVFLCNGLQCKTVSIFTLSDRFIEVCKQVFSQHKGWEIGNAWEVPLGVEVRDLPILNLATVDLSASQN